MTPSQTDHATNELTAPRRAPQPGRAPEVTTATMESFSCLAAACPDTCCRDWAVPIDRADLETMRTALSSTTTGADRLVHLIVVGRPSRHTDAVARLQLDERGACPLLEEDQRCSVHANAGEQALATACSVFPRTALAVEDRIEVGGSLGCPEVARLVLLADERPQLRPATKPMLPRAYIGKTVATAPGDAYAHHFVPVREALLSCFQLPLPLGTQLVIAADLAARVGEFFHAGTQDFDGAGRAFAERRLRSELETTGSAALHADLHRDLMALKAPGEGVMALVAGLVFERRQLPHGPRFGALLDGVLASASAGCPPEQAGTAAGLWMAYQHRRDSWDQRAGGEGQRLFQNYAQHFLQRNPYTDSSTLLEYLYRLAVHLAAVRLLTVLHPEAHADPDRASMNRIAVDVVQTFTKAIGHHPDYLEAALHRGAAATGGFTFGRLVMLAKFV